MCRLFFCDISAKPTFQITIQKLEDIRHERMTSDIAGEMPESNQHYSDFHCFVL